MMVHRYPDRRHGLKDEFDSVQRRCDIRLGCRVVQQVVVDDSTVKQQAEGQEWYVDPQELRQDVVQGGQWSL